MSKSNTNFQFSPEVLTTLHLETRTGTKHIPKEREPLDNPKTPGAHIISMAVARAKAKGNPLLDAYLMAEIREMTMQDILLSSHGYLDKELESLRKS